MATTRGAGAAKQPRTRKAPVRRSRLAFAPELPPDIWRIIFERLGETDLLRTADVAARDIAAAASACRTAREHAGAGWAALLTSEAGNPPDVVAIESDSTTQLWYETSQRLHKGKLSKAEIEEVWMTCLRPRCWYRLLGPPGTEPMGAVSQEDWLKRMLPLHSRTCPIGAVIAVLEARHGTIKAAAAAAQYRLTKRDLGTLERAPFHSYRLTDVRKLATQKWGDVHGLQERQRKVSAQVAKAKQTARAKQDAEHDFRRQSFLEAMRHAGVPEADFDAVMSQSTARMYLGVPLAELRGGVLVEKESWEYLTNKWEAPRFALSARRQHVEGVHDPLLAPNGVDPYTMDDGGLNIRFSIVEFGGGMTVTELSSKPETPFGRVAARFSFRKTQELDELTFEWQGKPIPKASFGKSLAEMGFKSGTRVSVKSFWQLWAHGPIVWMSSGESDSDEDGDDW